MHVNTYGFHNTTVFACMQASDTHLTSHHCTVQLHSSEFSIDVVEPGSIPCCASLCMGESPTGTLIHELIRRPCLGDLVSSKASLMLVPDQIHDAALKLYFYIYIERSPDMLFMLACREMTRAQVMLCQGMHPLIH